MTFIDDTMNPCGYDNATPRLQRLARREIFQHNNDPKHTAKKNQNTRSKKKPENFDMRVCT